VSGPRKIFALAVFLATTAAAAQPAPPDGPSPQDVQAASEAFAEGQRAQLRRDYARAAELFEIANASAPSAAALRSAVRNHRAAGHAAQAATGALEALALYADDRPTVQLANEVITELSPRLGRVILECAPECTATLDGRVLSSRAITARQIFVDPGNHVLRAEWQGYPPVERTVSAVAGQAQTLHLDRPPAPEPPPEPTPPPVEPPVEPIAPPPALPPPSPRSSGMSPAVFWIGTGVTAVLLGVSIWSGLDTLSARDDYRDDPTKERYDDGVQLELRTNALFVASGVLGAATIAIGLFLTDWQAGESAPVVALGPEGAILGWRGEL
jgi:hypothetical protein